MSETFDEVYSRFYGRLIGEEGPCYKVAKEIWEEAIKQMRYSLEDLIHDARLIKQCDSYDDCDICKAERLLK